MINIDDLIGVNYCVNGRSIETGFDCLGLAIEVERRFGHILPDLDEAKIDDYDFALCQKLCLSKIKNIVPVSKAEKEGDLILFEDNSGVMFHIGVYLGNNKFIHCNKYGVHLTEVGRIYKVGVVYRWQ